MYNYYTTVGSVAQPPASEEGGLSFNIWTFSFSIINIIILFLLLKWILFKPITNLMNARVERIKKNITDAQNNKSETEKIKNDYKDQLDKLKDESNTIINNAHQKAQVEVEDLIKKAKLEAELILQKAKEEGEREVEKALEAVKSQVANLVIQTASKVIQKNMDTDTNRKLIEEFIDEVGAA